MREAVERLWPELEWIESGELRVENISCNIAEVIDDVVAMMQVAECDPTVMKAADDAEQVVEKGVVERAVALLGKRLGVDVLER